MGICSGLRVYIMHAWLSRVFRQEILPEYPAAESRQNKMSKRSQEKADGGETKGEKK